jgi:N-acyl-D-amino-acid deacylase
MTSRCAAAARGFRWPLGFLLALVALGLVGPGQGQGQGQRQQPADQTFDVLLLNGWVLEGSGSPWFQQDIGIAGDRIAFIGNARVAGVVARDTLDVRGLVVTPGFWDVHNHAQLDTEHGRHALPMLYQGITTVVQGVDGAGTNQIAAEFARYRSQGIAVNVVRYVGHGAARGAVMGVADRAPTAAELHRMREYVRRGMEEGAVGLSSGLFYSPGSFADTDEVVELARVAAEYGGSYDTHDRDLGVAYQGIGYLASTREAIEIGERAGTPVIFSHFNAQGVHNHGRAVEGARLVEEARARGVNVMAGQHVYTATHSSLSAYALPRWASVGGQDEVRRRFRDPAIRQRLAREIPEMLEPRGGAEKIVFTAQRDGLNGRSLAEVASGWGLSVPDAVMRILDDGNAGVMNLDLYDEENTRFLAQQEWMMTCTDGYTPIFGEGTVHPRSYGAFTKKLRSYVLDEGIISLPFAIRGMTSLASQFYGFPDRGLLREGFHADIAVLDLERLRDLADFQNAHQYAEGTVHVLVNGRIAFRDGQPTGELAGRPLPRERGHVGGVSTRASAAAP